MKPEVALLDNEDMEEVSQDVDWQFVSLGEQQNFGIKTSGMKIVLDMHEDRHQHSIIHSLI